MKKDIYTIGHSNRTIEQFIELLKAYDIEEIADVRTIPESEHNPQFGKEKLKPILKKNKIKYIHIKDLGGLRHTTKNSINLGWRNASFRGYADYMSSDKFENGLKKLENIASKNRVAIMCAEALPWRCHRSLIADALMLDGWKVSDIYSVRNAKLHKITPFLKLKNGVIIYPNPNQN